MLLRRSLPLLFSYLLLLLVPATARIGDSLDIAEGRYGLPRKEPKPAAPLLDGAREVFYYYESWIIRCAYVRAVDGQEYVIRQEYRKSTKPEVLKKGGTAKIEPFEFEAILQAESNGSKWRDPAAAPAVVAQPVKSGTKQSAKPAPFVPAKAYQRPDGARAVLSANSDRIVLELPQAAKYEAELKAFRQQELRTQVPQF